MTVIVTGCHLWIWCEIKCNCFVVVVVVVVVLWHSCLPRMTWLQIDIKTGMKCVTWTYRATTHLENLIKLGNCEVAGENGETHWIMKWSYSFVCLFAMAVTQLYTVFWKSDAKIEITITMTNLIRINYPLSSFNYRLFGANIANFNKIHHTVSGQQLFKQEGQHPLTGQRSPPISGGTYRRRRTLIDGYLESRFPTACLL